MVFDVSMDRFVLFFTEGIKKPFRGVVKSHKLATFKDSMNLIRDLQNVLPRTKYPPKPNFPSKLKEGKKLWKKGLLYQIK